MGGAAMGTPRAALGRARAGRGSRGGNGNGIGRQGLHCARGGSHARTCGVSTSGEEPGRGRAGPTAARSSAGDGGGELPRLVKAALGRDVDRPPAWMMRQAGRYQKAYRVIAK